MGCDIHAYVEVKENDQWKYYDWRKEYQIGTYEDGSPEMDYDKLWDNPLRISQNYDLFAILANVRNGRGFAGVSTGTGFEPMDMPRGLPNDVTDEVQAESNSWDGDGHSHSYMLLSELLDFDYDGKTTTQYGTVGIEQYQEFKTNGKPKAWSGDIWGQSIKQVSNSAMDEILVSPNLVDELGFSFYTKVQWQETYREAVGEDWFTTLEELKKLGSPDNVRLVFFFDN